jgi:hypothetical protein
MKKIGIAVVLVIVAAVLVFMFVAKDAKQTAGSREWPMELGTLESVPARYPPRTTNEAAKELERLAKTDDAAAIRAHLLSGEPLVWEVDVRRGPAMPTPDFRAIMRAQKALAASTRDWEDLRAQWLLARPLWQRPDMISPMVAVTITSAVVERAATLPRTEPAWFDEVRTFDYRKAMLAGIQADTWATGALFRDVAKVDEKAGPVNRLHDWAVAPYLHLSRVDFLAHQRATAAALVNGARPPEIAWWNQPAQMAAPNLERAWKRVAELEAKVRR